MNSIPSFPSAELKIADLPDIKFEYAACPLCGRTAHEPVLRGRDPGSGVEFQVVRCRRCGLHFTNPRPPAAAIGRFYPTSYRPHLRSERTDRSLRSWYPLDWLQPPPAANGRPRLLDFGCGSGHFLAAMNRSGWDATGLDISEKAVATIQAQLGLHALAGSLPNQGLETGSFELITMWHALEHVYEPLACLREAGKLLAPGGRLIVAVPNFMSWLRQRFGPDWFSLDVPRHLTHFCSDTLCRMLEVTGFRVHEVRYARHADWVRSSALRARENGHSTPSSSLLQIKAAAAAAAWLWSRGKTGDALMVLAES